MGQPGDEEVQW